MDHSMWRPDGNPFRNPRLARHPASQDSPASTASLDGAASTHRISCLCSEPNSRAPSATRHAGQP